MGRKRIPSEEKLVPIGCRISPEKRNLINDLASVTGQKPSNIIQEAIEQYLRSAENLTKKLSFSLDVK